MTLTDLLSQVPVVAWVVTVLLLVLIIALVAYLCQRAKWCSDMVDVVVSQSAKGIPSDKDRARVNARWSPWRASVYWDVALTPDQGDATRVLTQLANLLEMEPTTVSPQRRSRRYYAAFRRGDRS